MFPCFSFKIWVYCTKECASRASDPFIRTIKKTYNAESSVCRIHTKSTAPTRKRTHDLRAAPCDAFAWYGSRKMKNCDGISCSTMKRLQCTRPPTRADATAECMQPCLVRELFHANLDMTGNNCATPKRNNAIEIHSPPRKSPEPTKR